MDSMSTLTLQDCLEIVRRRKWLILAAVVVCVGVAAALCKVLPKSYRSSTLILVETQKIPERYVQGVVSGTVQERLTMIKQQVMSRTVLGRVIEEFELYRSDGQPIPMEQAIKQMRGDVKVEIKGNQKHVDAFAISFAHEQPETAMKVTSALASRFVAENLRHREQFVEGAAEFLDHELARAKAELEKKEQHISQFKTKHMGELPEQMEANLRALDRIQNELLAADETAQRLTDRIATVEKAITEYESTGETTSEVGGKQSEGSQLFRRLRELERKLAKLLAEYKDTYPDVILTKQEIESLKGQIQEEYGEDTEGEQAAFADPYLGELARQRDAARGEVGSLKRRRAQLDLQKKDFERRVERAPALEQELLILVRDYENMKLNYNTLLDKRLNARVAENLERRQKGEQFRVIDPANLPHSPDEPDQLRIMLIGLAAGCALGFGSAFGLELLRRPFRRADEIEQQLGLHVLAAVPEFRFLYDKSPKWRGRAARRKLIGGRRSGHAQAVATEPRSSGKGGDGPGAGLSGATGNPESSQMVVVTKWQPRSVIAEQYRVIASQMSLLEAGRSCSIVALTSSVKGEGKSTTAINIAYTLARDLAKRTVLVDCDFKCPAVHRYLSLSQQPGLVDVLKDRAPLESSLRQIDDIPLWVLPVGGLSKQSTDLPRAQVLARLFGTLREQFEYILIDAPPILPLADMNVLGQLADELIMIIRACVTQQQVVHRALRTWRPRTPPHIILNGVEASDMPYYMHYDYHARSAEARTV